MNLFSRGMCRGFSLVEMVLVLIIVGVLAAVAAPRLLDRSAFQTHGASAEVRTALRYAQKLAMAKNREVCVTATAANLTLMFTDPPGPACSQFVLRPDGDASQPTYTVTSPSGIALTPMAFRFDGQGRPSPNIVLNLTVGGTVDITVERETGYVH